MSKHTPENITLDEYVPRFRTLRQMRKEFPKRRAECIGELLREGETLFLTAGTKMKKKLAHHFNGDCKKLRTAFLSASSP